MNVWQTIKRAYTKDLTRIKGRMRRRDYFTLIICTLIPLVLLQAAVAPTISERLAKQYEQYGTVSIEALTLPWHTTLISGLFTLLFFIAIPALVTASMRRLQDAGITGLLTILGLIIPIIGPLLLLLSCTFKGTPGPNRFGPDPRHPNGTSEELQNHTNSAKV